MASLSTYNELRAAVASYLGRDDLDEQIPTFIRMAEKRMDRDLRLRCMERRATAQVQAGAKGTSLPCRHVDGDWDVFMEMRDITWRPHEGGGEVVTLEYLPPDEFQVAGMRTGQPEAYTIIGSDLFFMPVPDVCGSLTMAYYAEVPPLSDAQECNAVLHTAPDLYLYGTLLESAPYTRGSVPYEMWTQFYTAAKQKLQHNEDHARYTAGLRMQPTRRI